MTLDKNTKVTIGLVIATMVPIFALLTIVWDVRRDVQQLKEDRYSLPAASEDALREAIENPGHRVPDPRNPGNVIVVKVGQIQPAGWTQPAVKPGG